LYFSSTDDEFICLDKTTGLEIWKKPVRAGLATSAALLNGVLVHGESQGSLRFVEAHKGKELAHFEPGLGIFSPPSVHEEQSLVYFISSEANLYSLRAGWAKPRAIPYLR